MSLLAQTLDDLPWFERYIDKYGLASVLVMLFGYFAWRYGPRIIDWVIQFGNDLSHNVASLSQNVQENTAVTRQTNETMSTMGQHIAQKMDPKGDPKFGHHIFSTVGTNQSILSLSRAARPFCDGLPDQQKQLVLRHLDDIERLLGGS